MAKYVPVISVVGKSGAGKTTLLERVITRLKKKGWCVAAIKHDAHRFEIDHPGKDTWRMAQAGADVVMISSSDKLAMIQKVVKEKTLDELIEMLPDVDIVLTEGYKTSNKPKIEVSRSEVHKEHLYSAEELIAMVSDVISVNLDVPTYHLDDIEGVVAEIEKYVESYRNSRCRGISTGEGRCVE